MYTSGTTGRPKGAVLTHGNLAGQAMTNLFTTGADINNDVGFVGVPLFHIAGIGNMITGLLLGLPTVVYPLGAFEPGALLDVLEAEKVTAIFLVPAQWQVVCAEQRANPRDIRLRVLLWGAAPASDTLLRPCPKPFPAARSWRHSAKPRCHRSRACCWPTTQFASGFGRKAHPDRHRAGRRRQHERRSGRSGR